jgi:hypothetical protein
LISRGRQTLEHEPARDVDPCPARSHDPLEPEIGQGAHGDAGGRQLLVLDDRVFGISVAVQQLVAPDRLLVIEDRLASEKDLCHGSADARSQDSDRPSRIGD